MKNLIPINKNEAIYFQDVICRKNNGSIKTRLEHMKPLVNQRYAQYLINTTSLNSIGESPFRESEDKTALQSCYTQDRENLLNEIRTKQFGNLRDRCQYCDCDRVSSLDHYLPKGEYPEFSILGVNLIPCCLTCNHDKSKLWLKEGQRQFINFYYDKIEDHRFLFCTVDFTQTSVIKFTIENRTNIDNDLLTTIKNHFKNMELFSPYAKECIEELSVIKEKLNELSECELKNHLNTQAIIEESKRGKNNYKVVFYKELANKIAEFKLFEFTRHI